MPNRQSDNGIGDRTFPFDVFISYATDPDYALVRELEVFLETFHETPTATGATLPALQVCVDGSDFSLPPTLSGGDASQELPNIVQSYLEASRRLLVLCSANARRSVWVRREITWFLQHRHAADIVLAVTEGTDPGRDPRAVFPVPVLRAGIHRRLWYDLRGHRRQANPGWKKVRDYDDNRVRLAADLLGVPAGMVRPAWFRAKRETEAARLSQARALSSKRLSIAARTFAPLRLDLALLLSAEAYSQSATGDARDALLTTLAQSPRLRCYLPGHRARITGLRFVAGREVLVVADLEGCVTLWRLGRSAPVARVQLPHNLKGTALSVSPDDKWVAIGCSDGSIRLHHVRKLQRPRKTLRGHHDGIRDLAFSPDGQWLASCSLDKTVRTWSLNGKSHRPPIQEAASAVVFGVTSDKLFIARNDQNVFSQALDDNAVYVFSVDTGTVAGEPLLAHRQAPSAIATDDRRRLLASVGGREAILWHLPERRYESLGAGAGGFLSVAFRHDGSRLAIGCGDHTVKLWNPAQPKRQPETLRAHADDVWQVAFGPGGLLASGSADGNVLLWDSTRAFSRRGFLARHPGVSHLAFSPDGKYLASCGNDAEHSLVIWDSFIGEPVGVRPKAHSDNVVDVCFSADGQLLATVGWDGTARLWATRGLAPQRRLVQGTRRLFCVSFSPRGDVVAIGDGGDGTEGRVRFRSVATGRPFGRPLVHTSSVRDLAFAPDGEVIATACGREIWIWRLTQKNAMPHVISCEGFIRTLRILRLESREVLLCASTLAGLVYTWNLSTLEPVGVALQAHNVPVFALDVRPDGRLMATGGADGILALWDFAGRSLVGPRVRLHEGGLDALAFSPDSTRLASATADGVIWIHDVSERSWQSRARMIANRDLTVEERLQFDVPVERSASPSPTDIIQLPVGFRTQGSKAGLRDKLEHASQIFERAKQRERRRSMWAARRREDAAAFASRAEVAEAVAAYDDAITTYRKLMRTNGSFELDLAATLGARGALLLSHNSNADATRNLTEAVVLYRREANERRETREQTRPARADAREVEVLSGLADALNNLGVADGGLASAQHALDYYDESVAVREQLIGLSDAPRPRAELARTLHNRGAVHQSKGDNETAIGEYARAASLWRQLLAEHQTAEHRLDLLRTLRAQAQVHEIIGPAADAVKVHTEAKATALTIFADSGVDEARVIAADESRAIGAGLEALGDYSNSMNAYAASIEILEDLVHDGVSEHRATLASALYRRSVVEERLGKLSEALRDVDRSLAAYDTAPDAQGFREERARVWHHRCLILDATRRADDTEAQRTSEPSTGAP